MNSNLAMGKPPSPCSPYVALRWRNGWDLAVANARGEAASRSKGDATPRANLCNTCYTHNLQFSSKSGARSHRSSLVPSSEDGEETEASGKATLGGDVTAAAVPATATADDVAGDPDPALGGGTGGEASETVPSGIPSPMGDKGQGEAGEQVAPPPQGPPPPSIGQDPVACPPGLDDEAGAAAAAAIPAATDDVLLEQAAACLTQSNVSLAGQGSVPKAPPQSSISRLGSSTLDPGSRPARPRDPRATSVPPPRPTKRKARQTNDEARFDGGGAELGNGNGIHSAHQLSSRKKLNTTLPRPPPHNRLEDAGFDLTGFAPTDAYGPSQTHMGYSYASAMALSAMVAPTLQQQQRRMLMGLHEQQQQQFANMYMNPHSNPQFLQFRNMQVNL